MGTGYMWSEAHGFFQRGRGLKGSIRVVEASEQTVELPQATVGGAFDGGAETDDEELAAVGFDVGQQLGSFLSVAEVSAGLGQVAHSQREGKVPRDEGKVVGGQSLETLSGLVELPQVGAYGSEHGPPRGRPWQSLLDRGPLVEDLGAPTLVDSARRDLSVVTERDADFAGVTEVAGLLRQFFRLGEVACSVHDGRFEHEYEVQAQSAVLGAGYCFGLFEGAFGLTGPAELDASDGDV
jgi:hypothetical protein